LMIAAERTGRQRAQVGYDLVWRSAATWRCPTFNRQTA